MPVAKNLFCCYFIEHKEDVAETNNKICIFYCLKNKSLLTLLND